MKIPSLTHIHPEACTFFLDNPDKSISLAVPEKRKPFLIKDSKHFREKQHLFSLKLSCGFVFLFWSFSQKPFPIWQELESEEVDKMPDNFLLPVANALVFRSSNFVFYSLLVKTVKTMTDFLESQKYSEVLKFQAVLGGVVAASFQKEDLIAVFSGSCLLHFYTLLAYSMLKGLEQDCSRANNSIETSGNTNLNETESLNESTLLCLVAFCTTQSYYQFDKVDWLGISIMPLIPILCKNIADQITDIILKKSIWNFMLSIIGLQLLCSESELNLQQIQGLAAAFFLLPAILEAFIEGCLIENYHP